MRVPTPSPSGLLWLLVGLSVPFRFAMERIRGFGKWGLAKLPQYDPAKDPTTETDDPAVNTVDPDGEASASAEQNPDPDSGKPSTVDPEAEAGGEHGS